MSRTMDLARTIIREQANSRKPQTLNNSRYLSILDRDRTVFASGNGMTIPELCDYLDIVSALRQADSYA